MKIVIKVKNGNLTLNGKQYNDLNLHERFFFENYINLKKTENEQ